MLTKEGITRYPSEYAATNPPQVRQSVNRIILANGELVIEQTSKKVTKRVNHYSKTIYFRSRLGDKVPIYTENKDLAKKRLPILAK